MRTLIRIAAVSAALMTTHSAFAASALVNACRTDLKAQCGAEMKAGGAPLKACMDKHFSDLSADCQVAIIRASAVGKACKADEKKLCADVKGGKGAMASCMRSHAADLSEDCKKALAKSAGK